MTPPAETGGIDHRSLLERTHRDDPRTAVIVRSYEVEERHLVELRGFVDAGECCRSSYVVGPGAVIHDAIPDRVVEVEARLAAGASATTRLGDTPTVLVEVGNGAVSVTPGDRLDPGVPGDPPVV